MSGDLTSSSANPYQSPRAIEYTPRWWLRLRKFFEPSPQQLFLKGRPIICEGIAFRIDPRSRKVLYAASPSAVDSSDRMDLIVDEALRVLPIFARENPRLRAGIARCRLCVRMIRDYRSDYNDFIREIEISRDEIEAALAAPLENEDSPD